MNRTRWLALAALLVLAALLLGSTVPVGASKEAGKKWSAATHKVRIH